MNGDHQAEQPHQSPEASLEPAAGPATASHEWHDPQRSPPSACLQSSGSIPSVTNHGTYCQALLIPSQCNRPNPLRSVPMLSRAPSPRFPIAIGRFWNNDLDSSAKRSAIPLFVGSIPTRPPAGSRRSSSHCRESSDLCLRRSAVRQIRRWPNRTGRDAANIRATADEPAVPNPPARPLPSCQRSSKTAVGKPPPWSTAVSARSVRPKEAPHAYAPA